MAQHSILYYITDRSAFPGDESARRRRLLEKISEAASVGIDYIQLREKDLCARDLESLAQDAMRIILQLRTENRSPDQLPHRRSSSRCSRRRSPSIQRRFAERRSTSMEVWRGHPRPRSLTTRPADLHLLSLSSRSSPSRLKPRHRRPFRSRLRKKGRARRSACGARCSSSSLPLGNPRARIGRSDSAERSVLPARRRRRHRRHPPLPGKRHRHRRSRIARILAAFSWWVFAFWRRSASDAI